MKIFLFALGLMGMTGSAKAGLLESHALAPTFHFIQLVTPGADGKCELNVEHSIDFAKPFGKSSSFLKDLVLNLSSVDEAGGEKFRKVEIAGSTTADETVRISFITTRTATDWLINGSPFRKTATARVLSMNRS